MADVQYLSSALEGVSVQDENYDGNAPYAQHKSKVRKRRICTKDSPY